ADEYAVFVGGMHGKNHFTSSFIMNFFFELCSAFENDGTIEGLKVKRALSGRGLIVIPCLNPDGCEIATKGKSALLNMKNPPTFLARNSFSDFTYNLRGVDLDRIFDIAPKKECESSALYDFCKATPIRHVIVFEGGEGQIIAPCLNRNLQRSIQMSEIMITSTGYPVRFSEEGFTNWFSHTFKKPSFTALTPPPNEKEYPKGYLELRELMMLSAIM
ncbi:MAG: hypothetical protein J6Q74_02105, partial [Clostridia bacterium]|nr:hypothetical protein [Clostridia bacterium]